MKTSLITYLYIILVSLLSILVFPVILEPLDNDVFYHLLVAREMIDSKTPFFLHEPWFNAPDGLPHTYPPLFHWVLVVFSLGGIVDMLQLAIVMQIIFYPLALLSFYHLVSYVENKDTAFVAVVVLSTFFPFFGRTHLAIPEALQHVLIPLAFLTYLKGRENLCGVILAMLLINHVYDSLLIMLAICIHWTLYKQKSFNIKRTLLIASPGMIFQLYGIYGNLTLVLTHYPTVSYYLYRIFLALISSSILLAFGFWCFRRRLISKETAIFYIWFLFIIPIFFRLPNRFPAYAGMPLAVLASVLIMELRNEKRRFYTPHLLIVVGLLLANVHISYIAFPHVYDFYKPGVDMNERLALLWIESNVLWDDVIQLDPRRTRYDGYRISYFTGHKTTELDNLSNYKYSISPEPPTGNWTLVKGYTIYNIYAKN